MKIKEMQKVAIITQARVGSSRLPGKTLLPINGTSILEYHLKRLKAAGETIIVATTTEKDAFKLCDIASRLGCESSIGPLDDVLSRFYIAAKRFKADIVVRVTSDCPLIDSGIIAEAIKIFKARPDWENSYLSNTQHRLFPRGFDFEIFSFKLLEEAHLNALEMFEREHVTPYIYKNPNCKASIVHYESTLLSVDKSHYRITVDTSEDFELISKLIADHQCDQKDFTGIIQVLDSHPELAKINQLIEQKKL